MWLVAVAHQLAATSDHGQFFWGRISNLVQRAPTTTTTTTPAMAATANSLRHCLRTCSRPPPSLRTAALRQRRALSTTPALRRDEQEPEETLGIPTYAEGIEHLLKRKELQPSDRPMLETLLKELQDNPDKAEFYERKYRARRDWSRVPYHEGISPLSRPVKPKAKRASFWNKDEPDPDLVTPEIGEDEWEEDDMLSIAHDKLEEHREYRQYARITVWEMPLLASKGFLGKGVVGVG